MTYKITSEEINLISPFIENLTGLVLDHSKDYLFNSRLNPVLEKYSLQNFVSLIEASTLNKNIERDIIDAITTKETMFFRDKHPFEFIQNRFFPDFFEKKGFSSEINIWSAASSTGQEVYSIAFTLYNILFDLTKYNVNLIATDISDEALKKASRGFYTNFELSRGLNGNQINRYFNTSETGGKIKDEIRQSVQFKTINLIKPYPQDLKKMDLIFCRNVAIYFSRRDRIKLYDKLADQLNSGGVLIISSTESLLGICERFEKKVFRNTFYYQLID